MKRKLYRLLCLFLTILLLCTGVPVTASAKRFSDVPNGVWFADAVNAMVDRGVISGVTNTAFVPYARLTRAQFVSMLAHCALSEGEIQAYFYSGRFVDVPTTHWANGCVNWAYEAGVVSGKSKNRFAPNEYVSRQDMAVMVVNYAKAVGLELPATQGPIMFLDRNSIDSYAKDSVTVCQRAGMLSGYEDITFRPKNTAQRCEAAMVVSQFLDKSRSAGYKIIRKRMYGLSISAVEFDPSNFMAGVALGSNRVRGAESMTSIVNRTGAKIAVNAGFFDMSSYDPYSTIISDSKWVTLFNMFSPAKSAITMDSSGNFSVENYYARLYADLTTPDGTQMTRHTLGVNRYPGAGDGTKLIFNSYWGSSLGFVPEFAAAVNTSGEVTAIYHNQDVSIPQSGYLLVVRSPKDDAFVKAITVGSLINLRMDYEGSTTQDIKLSIGVGPKIVENGRAYGDASTYAAEGLASSAGGTARRVCIGVRYDGKLVILTAADASLRNLSDIMVAMGCKSAVNLDGGGSTNLYVDGQWLYGPQNRLLSNVLYFK
ncbi:S-layer homology domain-containing protein [Acutalibacter caecimuris]|uniref:S-layer homology domain-containing protein n=1 Tax=Acutalibacter caecimuris TaxID=3093657 RepID=UPI002AC93973|nr:S-layer homology domain-containing protein [Acutalibacter sp. M00118]